jgi:hypothetical protein
MLWSVRHEFRRVQARGALSKPSGASKAVTYSRPGVKSIAASKLGRRQLTENGNAGHTSAGCGAEKRANGVARQRGSGEIPNHAVEVENV